LALLWQDYCQYLQTQYNFGKSRKERKKKKEGMNEITTENSDQTAVGDNHPMSFLLTEDLSVGIPNEGEVRKGVVVEHRNNEILVDIGAKSEGLIPSREFETLDTETKERLAVGNEILVAIIDPEDKNGNIILSFTKAVEEQDWQTAQTLLENQEVYQGKVIGYNRGGVLVRMGQVRAFVPTSQLAANRQVRGGTSSEEQLRAIVGDTVFAKVIEVDRERNRLILSERAAAKEMRESQRKNLMEDLAEGQVRKGRVVNLADFGAFIDIGGVEGLIHLSELSWKRVNHPSDKLSLGQNLDVYILGVDEERQRVALSLKKLEADPWSAINERYQVGQLLEVTVTKLTKYGAFARLDDEYELEGLIHISELSDDHIKHPRDVVQKSQTVAARIIRIDPEQRQLGLSLKQVSADHFMAADLAFAAEQEQAAAEA
jgi:small subunit ribosomal protein S1